MSDRRGILVPIDAHGINRATLERVVTLAQQLDRSLLGLLLDNPDLSRISQLPFVTEIALGSGQERSLTGRYASGRGYGANRTRVLLDELAARHRVELRFEHVAGDRLAAALAGDAGLDVFFPARGRWQLAGASYYPGLRPFRTLGVILTGGEGDKPVLAMANALLKLESPAQIYLHCVGEPSDGALRALAGRGVRLCVQSNFPTDARVLAQLIRRSAYDLLLLPREAIVAMPAQELTSALDSASGQVLMIT